MKYIPDIEKLNSGEIESLFSGLVPSSVSKTDTLLFKPFSEMELRRHFQELTRQNPAKDFICFLGMGAYDHYIPSVVDALSSRSEFTTSYTQYQPELSQGYLQALFEFQTMICSLTGMDIANTSMYDGASALAEAVLMAARITGKNETLVSGGIHPFAEKTLRSYVSGGANLVIRNLPLNLNGQTDFSYLGEISEKSNFACLVVQTPNFYGIIEDLERVAAWAHDRKILFIISCNPISLGILKTPGELGADIAVGEGQPLGIPLSFGGPYFGFFAAKKEYVRQMPGRLVGETIDRSGQRAFCLTLSTREQHIRRYNATSNICTNQALCALRAAIYMTAMGADGICRVAQSSFDKAHYLADRIASLRTFRLAFSSPFFNEFLVKLTAGSGLARVKEKLLEAKILVGFGRSFSLKLEDDSFLVAVTEQRTRGEMDYLVRVLKEAEDE